MRLFFPGLIAVPLLLIITGEFLLLDRLAILDIGSLRELWPATLIVAGLAELYRWANAGGGSDESTLGPNDSRPRADRDGNTDVPRHIWDICPFGGWRLLAAVAGGVCKFRDSRRRDARGLIWAITILAIGSLLLLGNLHYLRITIGDCGRYS